MRIIARKTLKEAWAKHRDAESPLKAWFKEVEAAEWNGPEDLSDIERPSMYRKLQARTKNKKEAKPARRAS